VASSERSGTPGAPSLSPKLGVSPPPRNSAPDGLDLYATAALAFAGGGRGGGGGGSAPPSLPNLVLTLLPGWGIVWRGWP